MSYSVFEYRFSDLSLMPHRPERSHKGRFGRVLCVCGSRGMAGASYLSALGALRTGAGLCEILCPEENRIILQTLIPEAVLSVYDRSCPDESTLLSAIARADAIVVGCGLGTDTAALSLLRTVLRNRGDVTTVVDADALTLLSAHPSLLRAARGCILTPHASEMSRLCGLGIASVLAEHEALCHDFAAAHGVVCVLKDHHTAVSDGHGTLYRNQSGNSGMATGGSGDVLTGIIAAIAAQAHGSLTPLQIASLGVFLHGLAGDAAAERLSPYAMLAHDVADSLGDVFLRARQENVLSY